MRQTERLCRDHGSRGRQGGRPGAQNARRPCAGSLRGSDGDPAGTLEVRSAEALALLKEEGNYLFLQQDLVDRQIIDINGRKVVRVNDVDLEWMGSGAVHLLRVAEVEVGLRGAFRRVFKAFCRAPRLESVSRKFSARAIPWQFVDVIEPDPARRVRLRIEHERLADIHPSSWPTFWRICARRARGRLYLAQRGGSCRDPRGGRTQAAKGAARKARRGAHRRHRGRDGPRRRSRPAQRAAWDQSDAILEEMEPEERQEVQELSSSTSTPPPVG